MKGGLVMEVLVIPYDSRLQLSLVTGINPESGKPIIKKTYFNNVKYDADEQDDAIEAVMDTIIEKGIFHNKGNDLITKVNARIVEYSSTDVMDVGPNE